MKMRPSLSLVGWLMMGLMFANGAEPAATKSPAASKETAKEATTAKAAPAKPVAAPKSAPAEKSPSDATPAPAKAPAPATVPAPAKAPAAAQAPLVSAPYRPLAPGAMQVIEPQPQPVEAFSRHDIVELLAVDPKMDFAKNIAFRRDIWYLEFRFKPVRMIYVDIPQPSGQMQRKLIWYLVYSVTNPGKAWHPVEQQDGTYQLQQVDKPVRFVPTLLLEAVGLDKWYPDRVIPLAMDAIRLREDPNRQFLNTVEMNRELQPGETLWGAATWEDTDPKIYQFAIYVTGLTNAYRWVDEAGKFQKGSTIGTGRHLERKTLKLNFRRIGDEFDVRENQIRYGLPDGVDYEWVYR